MSESKRYASEPIAFLGSVLEKFAAGADSESKPYITCPSLNIFDNSNFQFQSAPTKLKPQPLDFTSLPFSDETELTDQQKYVTQCELCES